jgi:aryl-alcohol dehydrogenase-like predicted oxidoreductase
MAAKILQMVLKWVMASKSEVMSFWILQAFENSIALPPKPVVARSGARAILSFMEYRNLGRTGVRVSPLCLGCMMFGGKTSAEDSYAIIDHALDAGINFLDTANVYSRGGSEEVTGEALRRNGKRDRVVLATKVHSPMDDTDPNAGGNSRRHIIQQCEASLRRLKTDWIDLYQIHRPQSSIPIDETLRALDDLVRAGKVRYLGTSTFGAWQVMESLMVSRELGLNRFVCEQPPYNLLDRRAERELLPMARTHGVGIIPWSPMAGGLLSGKYGTTRMPEDGRFTDVSKSPILARRKNEKALAAVDAYLVHCAARGVVPSQLAVSWVMARPGVSSAIIGPRTLDQLKDNLKSLEVPLTLEDTTALDAIFPPGDYLSKFYEADFGPRLVA